MIACFSGTGNSRRVADYIQDALGDELVRFAPGQMLNPRKANLRVTDGRVIWVCPVHAWGMPKAAARVIKYMNLIFDENVKHYLVLTCGDDIGYADHHWRHLMKKRKWNARAAFSVQMPNTYCFMKGFDVDPEDVAAKKLKAMPSRMAAIVDAIDNDDDMVDVVRGRYPWVKTSILHPLFIAFAHSTKPFHVTDACKGCGKCARNCSVVSIQMVDGKPHWGKECNMCLRCYHCCPHHAIAYGKATEGKGQYICPDYPLKD